MPYTNLAFKEHLTGASAFSGKDRYIPRQLNIESSGYALSTAADRRWELDARSKLGVLLMLPQNWDSYGAPPIDRGLATTALQLLGAVMQTNVPLPWIVPTATGKLQIEWHCKGIDLEVQIKSPTSLHVSFEDMNSGEGWERELTVDLAPLTNVIAELAQR